MKKYLHEHYDEYVTIKCAASLGGKITWGDFLAEFDQPKWCAYPDACLGSLGCWSLVGEYVNGEEYCVGCEYYCKGVSE